MQPDHDCVSFHHLVRLLYQKNGLSLTRCRRIIVRHNASDAGMLEVWQAFEGKFDSQASVVIGWLLR